MKKTLVLLLISLFTISLTAQDSRESDSHYYDGVEKRTDLKLSANQKKQIIDIKKNIGRRYADIGRDRSLTGYEKGQKKRELSKEIRKEIDDVLNSEQKTFWDKTNSSSWDMKLPAKIKIESIEDEIDELEYQYNRDVKVIERNSNLSKVERKRQKQSLKDKFKDEKEKLKREKEKIKDSIRY